MRLLFPGMILTLAPIAAADSADRWAWGLETGYLWGLETNTALDYEIIPTQLTLHSPVVWTLAQDETGARWVVRSRYALLWEHFTRGPEDYYLGLSAAPSLEYHFPSGKNKVFLAVGGGLGVINSAGGAEGQGQDLTLNWFAQLGGRHQLSENLSLLGSLYFVHHSNGGLTDPNPGIDALGFTLGVGWKF